MDEENTVIEPEVQETEEVEQIEEQVEEQPEQKKDNLDQWKSKNQKRIDKLTANNYEKESKIAALEAKLDTFISLQQPQQQVQTGGRPDPDNFETTEDYNEALIDYKVEQRAQRFETDRKQTQAQQEKYTQEQEIKTSFAKRQEIAMEKYDDYLEVAGNPDVLVSPEMKDNIMDSEMSADLMYYFGNNPDEAKKLLNLRGKQLTRKFGTIEASIKKPTQKKKTQAPAPISPIKGSKNSSGVKDINKLSTTDFMRLRNEGKL
tara:strand:+ start:1300 stop:2082 length:783 start_codon:yes stop_codon:yes gene_type:complete